MMGWKLDYFQKVSVFENLSKAQIWPKRKYHLFSHLIWRKFQVFDKSLGNFENLYLRNVIKINYRGGLPTLDFFKKWGSKKMLAKMTKIKVVPNCVKWWENWLKPIFGFYQGRAKRDYWWAKRDYRWASPLQWNSS